MHKIPTAAPVAHMQERALLRRESAISSMAERWVAEERVQKALMQLPIIRARKADAKRSRVRGLLLPAAIRYHLGIPSLPVTLTSLRASDEASTLILH